ncbi:MAG: alanine racemase [Firmicutes bacterium]|nr:alanine racemase [Bacillota bacterium]
MNDQILAQAAALGGTSCYVFDTDALKERVTWLREHLPEGTSLCYAVKANPFLAGEIAPAIDRLEICSPGELEICNRLGCDPARYVISGVYKARDAMEAQFSRCGAETYTVESLSQYRLLKGLALDAQKPMRLLIRLTSGNQFGLSRPDLETVLTDALARPLLTVAGLQFYSGTQKTSAKRLAKELAELDAYLEELKDRYAYEAEELEYGPGLPASYFRGDSFDEEAHLLAFSEALNTMRFSGRIILELGRGIAAGCGSYLTRVVDEKTVDGQRFAITDGGIHQLTYYGQFMAMKHPFIHLLTPHPGEKEEEWTVFGSLCTVNDILVKRIPLAGLRTGDVLVFERAGAYCVTEGMSLFLSRDLPAVVLCSGGRLRLVRKNTPTDGLNTPENAPFSAGQK